MQIEANFIFLGLTKMDEIIKIEMYSSAVGASKFTRKIFQYSIIANSRKN